MKRSSANTTSNGGAPQSPGSQGAAGEGHSNNSSSGDHGQRNSQSRSFNDHPQQQRNSFRNRNGGPHSRGDGSHHHSYGGRRNDQDRSNQDWNAHRNFNRDGGHVQPSPGVSPRLMRPPPPPPPLPAAAATFVAPPPVRPFSPMGFPGKPYLFPVLLWLTHGSALMSQSISRYAIAAVLCCPTSRFYERCAYYCGTNTTSCCFFLFRSPVA